MAISGWQISCAARAVAFVMFATLAQTANGADQVSVGATNTSADAPLFIADAKGYFKEAGIELKFAPFDTGAKMIAPLGAGELDVGGGAASAGLYNAVERGIDIKIVADRARNVPGFGFHAILVRKDLFDKGEVRKVADLKGRTVALVAATASDASVLNEAAKSAGIAFNDINKVYLGFAQQPAAFQNGAIDAAITSEPTVTAIVRAGFAVRLTGNDAHYPNAQAGVLMYNGDFATKRADVAKRFMTAYLRAVRDYNNALKEGHIAGPGADEIIAILAKYSHIKDRETLRMMFSHGCDPDGRVNVESLKKDWQFFRDQGHVKGTVTVEKVVDLSFVEAVSKELGPYKRGM